MGYLCESLLGDHVATKPINVKDLGRIRAIIGVLARHGFGQLFANTKFDSSVEMPNVPTSRPYAKRVRQALIELGPTYVKFGQVMSVRPDMLPSALIQELKTLQENVPPFSFDEVLQVIESETGAPFGETFSHIEKSPIGAASIAQVHQATLCDGTTVAIKLQRPNIQATIRSDIHILYTIAKMLEGRLDMIGLHTPTGIVQEFDRAIQGELDFLQEMRGGVRLAANFSDDPDILIPAMYPACSTSRMLVMECVSGTSLSVLLNDELPKERATQIAHLLMSATYKQVFEHGFFHGDPHPGNLLVTDDDKLIFLDFGVTATLTGAMQETIISEFTALVFRDPEALAVAIQAAGATKGRVDMRAFTQEIERLMTKYHGASLDDLSSTSTLLEILEVTSRYNIDFPPEYTLLARTLGLVEGSIRALLPDVDIVSEVRPYAQQLISSRFSPEKLASNAAKMMFQLQNHSRGLPMQMHQVLLDLEAGQLVVEAKVPQVAHLVEEVRASTLRLSLSILAGATILGGLRLLPSSEMTIFGRPLDTVLGGTSIAIGVSFMLIALLHYLLSSSLKNGIIGRTVMRAVRFFFSTEQ